MRGAAPIPDALLAPLVETAGDTLRALDDAAVPGALRHLRSFDRRGFTHGPAPRQVRTVLERDMTFRDAVVARFNARPDVSAIAEAWERDKSVELVDRCDANGDLALLASILWASDDETAPFWLGFVHARFEERQRAADQRADAQQHARVHEETTEARRRADAARMAAEAEVERVNAELREERRARRAREEDALGEAKAAHRRAEGLSAQLEQAQAARVEAEARASREARRAQELDTALRAAREELEQPSAQRGVLGAEDVRALADAANAARRLATNIDDVARRATDEAADRPRSRGRARASSTPPRAPARRTQPDLPPGMVADSAAGADAMLRTEGVTLVVDGYNVAKRAWADATPGDQRERLAVALAALHTRLGCSSTVVFDGDSATGPGGIRRRGLRVLFSGVDEEADDVVIRELSRLPKRVPVVVASSDAWVREHAEKHGAVVIAAETLLAVTRA